MSTVHTNSKLPNRTMPVLMGLNRFINIDKETELIACPTYTFTNFSEKKCKPCFETIAEVDTEAKTPESLNVLILAK